MQLIIFHKSEKVSTNSNKPLLDTQNITEAENLLQLMSKEPLKNFVFDIVDCKTDRAYTQKKILLPNIWFDRIEKDVSGITFYKDSIPLAVDAITNQNFKWLIISNGKFAVKTDCPDLKELINDLHHDVVAVNINPQIRSGCERPIIGPENKLLGFRRLYDNQVWPAAIPLTWPHRVYIRKNVLTKLLKDNALPLNFKELMECCKNNSLSVRSLEVAGFTFDLQKETGLLTFLHSIFKNSGSRGYQQNLSRFNQNTADNIQVSDSARIIGPVIFGNNIHVDTDAIVVGPAVICDNVVLEKRSTVVSSVIGPDVKIPQDSYVKNKTLLRTPENSKKLKINGPSITALEFDKTNTFRAWPKFSYAGCFKRATDIIAAALVLILFAPIFPVITLAIKLTSKGPVFYRDPRQGLRGKPFKCIKFRTMLVGADEMQEKLRSLNQADGPQFKIEDDPRISLVGKFLRDTYIDEIPQFLNVLWGQMSVVGPRPSPESENTLCPSWRDARLSVRPGITGLWQICRTRQPMKDFQEWIYYDTKYVRQLSLKMDLWISWKTMKKMAKNFIEKF